MSNGDTVSNFSKWFRDNMLRPSALKSLLGQANSGGVRATLLINREGSLVAYAGAEDTEARIQGAIAASLWWVGLKSSLFLASD